MTENVWLWIAQGLLAALFGAAGVTKAMLPMPRLVAMMDWTGAVPVALTRLIGVAELAAAVAMVLPIALDILPWLTPLAALGLIAIQLVAIGFHLRAGETLKSLPMNLLLGALAAFVLWGRFDLFGV